MEELIDALAEHFHDGQLVLTNRYSIKIKVDDAIWIRIMAHQGNYSIQYQVYRPNIKSWVPYHHSPSIIRIPFFHLDRAIKTILEMYRDEIKGAVPMDIE